jgi:phage-related protein
MPAIGAGVAEIRLRDEAGIFRAFYVAKFVEAVYVLHCFQKRRRRSTRAISNSDADVSSSSWRNEVHERRRERI